MYAATRALPVLAVTGLRAEARIAAGPGVATLAGGGDPARLASLLRETLTAGTRGVISFGIAGGLAPGLPAGTVVVADTIDDADVRWPTDAAWCTRLVSLLPQAVRGSLAGVDRPVVDAAAKIALHSRSGAVAVDMESHIVARLAAQEGLPFVALRVIADPAERTLPASALVGMRPDGSTDVLAVLRTLAKTPCDLFGLMQTAFDARTAFASLTLTRRRLYPSLGFHDEIFEPAREAAVCRER